jgi:copper chaperone CopZ
MYFLFIDEGLMFIYFLVFQVLAMEVWIIPKMNCTRCEGDVKKIVNQIEGVEIVEISFASRKVCLESTKDQAYDLLKEELAKLEYEIEVSSQQEDCKFQRQSSWDGVEGDFKVVSNGERFSLRKNKVKDKFTLFDFGAVWCGPCHDYAMALKPLLQTNDKLAIRAIELGDNQLTSFDHPVVFQYLMEAEGIPWMILYDPDGKKIYEGNDLEAVLKLIE